MAEIKIDKKIYSNSSVNKVINRSFGELITETPPIDIGSFFTQYNQLFYDIPKSGSENSHLTLIEQSSDYLVNFQDERDQRIDELTQQIEDLEAELDRIEEIQLEQEDSENPYFKNGSFVAGQGGIYLMEKGYKRNLTFNAWKTFKKVNKIPAGTKDEDIYISPGESVLAGIPEGPVFTNNSFTESEAEWKIFLDETVVEGEIVESFPMTYLSFRPDNIIPVHLAERPPKGTIVKGDTVEISNTKTFDARYIVRRIFIDNNNNVGAVFLKITSYTPTGSTDRTFQDIGKISLIR